MWWSKGKNLVKKVSKGWYILLLLMGCMTVFTLFTFGGPVTPPSWMKEPELQCPCTLSSKKGSKVSLDAFHQSITWLNETTEEHLTNRHPNFPVQMALEISRSGKCHLMPSHLSISWINTYWQEAILDNDSTFLLYSAFYDNRTETDIRPCVRLLGVTMALTVPQCWCQFWFNSTSPPSISKVQRIEYLDYQTKSESRQMTYLLTCQVPVADLKPEAVSLVQNPCQKATNLLQVIGAGEREPSAFLMANETSSSYSRQKKMYSAAVCGPALYYYHNDFSYRLVEWLEILRAQDISQVFLYETDIHPNLQKVLRYYEDEGFVHVTKYLYPPPYVNEPSIRRLWTVVKRPEMFGQENVYFTDCLLRHMHEYRFIAHYDPDEVPIILRQPSYTEFLHRHLRIAERETTKEKKPLPIGYQLRWNIFYNDASIPNATQELPEYLYMMRHIMRPKEDYKSLPGSYKTLYDMDFVTGVYSHSALICAAGTCPSKAIKISPEEAYLAHFTRTCGNKCKNATYMREEKHLLRDRRKVQSAVELVLKNLKLL